MGPRKSKQAMVESISILGLPMVFDFREVSSLS
jgi:hypothetical protein